MRELEQTEASRGPTGVARHLVFSPDTYARDVAAWFAARLPSSGRVVLTGGPAAKAVYPELARADASWGGLSVSFSDERCVAPTSRESNYGMVERLLLRRVKPLRVHRARGELAPALAAAEYAREIEADFEARIELALLGLGENTHVCALFPGAPSLEEHERLAIAVDRPDGMAGVTLTPRALASLREVAVLARGAAFAEAVRRTLRGHESVETCPAKLLADRPGVTFLLDTDAAGRL